MKRGMVFSDGLSYMLKRKAFHELSLESLFEEIIKIEFGKLDFDIAIEVIFERRGREACAYQEKLMRAWLTEKIDFFKSSAKKDFWIHCFFKAISDVSGNLTHKLLCLLMINSCNEDLDERLPTLVNELFAILNKDLSDSNSIGHELGIGMFEVLALRLSDAQLLDLKTLLTDKLNHTDWKVCITTVKVLDKLSAELLHARISDLINKLFDSLVDDLADESDILSDESDNLSDDQNEDTDEQTKIKLLNILVQKLSAAEFLDLTTVLVNKLNDEDWRVRFVAIKLLDMLVPSDSLIVQQLGLIDKFIDKLDDENSEICQAVIEALIKLASNMSDIQRLNSINKLIDKLDSENYIYLFLARVANQALSVLTSKLVSVPDNLITTFSIKLNATDPKICLTAIKVLTVLPSDLLHKQPVNLIDCFINKLVDEHSDIYQEVIKALIKHDSIISDTERKNLITILFSQLNGEDSFACRRAIKMLSELAPNMIQRIDLIFETLIDKLNAEDPSIRLLVIEALDRLTPNLSNVQQKNFITTLFNKLDDKNPYVCEAAIETLSGLASSLSDIQLEDLIDRLINKINHENPCVCQIVISTLDKLNSVFSTIHAVDLINKLTNKLNKKDSDDYEIVINAVGVLGPKLANLPDNLVAALIDKLNTLNYLYWEVVSLLEVLGQLASKLSSAQRLSVVKELTIKLNDRNPRIQKAVLKSLGLLVSDLISIPDDLITALISKLNDKNIYIRQETIQVLSAAILKLTEKQLKNVSVDIKPSTVESMIMQYISRKVASFFYKEPEMNGAMSLRV